MVTAQETKEIIEKFGSNANDTGSTPVQIALITKRIENLKPHFQKHIHDFHSNRGLLKLVGQRKRLLRYYYEKDREGYAKLIKALGLRK